MHVRVFEKRPGAWHLDVRGIPGKPRARPYAGTTEAEAKRQTAAILAKLLGSAPASAPVPQPEPAKAPEVATGPTMGQAFRRALKEREQWITSKDRGSLQTTFDSIIEGTEGVSEDTPMGTWTRAFTLAARNAWLAAPGKRVGTTLSPSTINHRLSMLSVLLEVCELPPHTVKHLSTRGNRRKRRISDAEVQAGLSWLAANASRRGATSMAVLIQLGLGTAARRGELLGLEWAQVDLTEGLASMTLQDTKNGETRVVPLPESCAALLRARRGLPRPFPDLDDDRATALWQDMRAAMGLASDDEFVFHALRHEWASRAADRGENAFVMQQVLGHASVVTTQVYTKAALSAMREAVNRGATQ